ncbi:hypothetical protein TNIN_435981 [Trichonephila inaurata madagascariensis]|uniref:Uncharacterized protein n=1 Tax=Trichonephila inaurata madagascariensis TaxID=2747483 RepID=A0A8X6JVT4_9ARAC|nr:hypothetical protein TNIN_435981 [Trichonephila inaurata madagascariensis]
MSLPAFDTAVPNSGFAIRASLPYFLCPGCRSFRSLYLPVVLTSHHSLMLHFRPPPHREDLPIQAAGSSHPPPL